MNSSHYFLLLLCPLSSLWLVGLFCARSFFVLTTTAIFAKKKVLRNVWIKLVNFDHYFGIRFFNPKEEIRSEWKLWKILFSLDRELWTLFSSLIDSLKCADWIGRLLRVATRTFVSLHWWKRLFNKILPIAVNYTKILAVKCEFRIEIKVKKQGSCSIHVSPRASHSLESNFAHYRSAQYTNRYFSVLWME